MFIDSFIFYKSGFEFCSAKFIKFSSNPGKVHFEGLVHLLGCISYNKNVGLKYYDDMNYASVSDIFRQSIIKTENQLMAFSDSSCKDCPDTVRSTGSYTIFYQVGPIDHGTYVPGPVSQSSA